MRAVPVGTSIVSAFPRQCFSEMERTADGRPYGREGRQSQGRHAPLRSPVHESKEKADYPLSLCTANSAFRQSSR